MRNRAWRRYKKECIIIKRLASKVDRCHTPDDKNGIYYSNPSVRNFLGTSDYFRSKSYTTSRSDSKYKRKYSPNRSFYYRGGLDTHKRETNKIIFINILKEANVKY